MRRRLYWRLRWWLRNWEFSRRRSARARQVSGWGTSPSIVEWAATTFVAEWLKDDLMPRMPDNWGFSWRG